VSLLVDGPARVRRWAPWLITALGALLTRRRPGTGAAVVGVLTLVAVGVAPGGAVSFPLAWRMHAAGTDPTTPQSVHVALAGAGTWSDVVLDEGPAPFDLADGATVTAGAWRPGPG
jgi:hypothetical protein